MKRLVFLLLIIILVGCSKTKVIYYEDLQENTESYQMTNMSKESEKFNITENRTNTSSILTFENKSDFEKNETKKIYDETVKKTITENYKIISCCGDGKIYAETSGMKSDYTAEDVKKILLSIYEENCDRLKNFVLHRIYLKYKNAPSYDSQLLYFKNVSYNTSYKRIFVDYDVVATNFTECS